MCLNKKWIRNQYDGRWYFVKCGHCMACQQEKANKLSQRIQNQFSKNLDCFFVTLTYDNKYIPYIRLSELDDLEHVNIYRDHSVNHYRIGKSRRSALYVDYECKILSVCDLSDLSDVDHIFTLRNGDPDKVGVIFYKDVQDFCKRFRIYLQRKFNYEKYLKILCVSEYGRRFKRPHFHLLIFMEKGSYDKALSAYMSSWSYANYYRKKRGFEVARRPASYLSSYLSKHFNLQSIYNCYAIRQKHSFSFGFGFAKKLFTLSSLLEHIDRGDLSFTAAIPNEHGVPIFRTFLFPKYVINKWFPKFKGVTKLSSSALYHVLVSPESVCGYRSSFGIDLSDEDIHAIVIKLRHLHNNFSSPYDFAHYYIRCWSLYYANAMRLSFDDVHDKYDLFQQYDNISNLLHHHVDSDLYDLLFDIDLPMDPNLFPLSVKNDDRLTFRYKQNAYKRFLSDSLHTLGEDYSF